MKVYHIFFKQKEYMDTEYCPLLRPIEDNLMEQVKGAHGKHHLKPFYKRNITE